MIDRFVNRTNFQRQIIKMVNGSGASKHELAGLTEPAIQRWIDSSQIGDASRIQKSLLAISEIFGLLSCQSQEAIDSEYEKVENNAISEAEALERLLKEVKSTSII